MRRALSHRLAVLLTSLVVLVGAPAFAFFSLSGFQNSMIEFLIDQLSTEGEFEITVAKVIEDEDGATAIQGLEIRDSKGVWLTAETLDFAWNPSRLLRGEVEFSRLRIQGVEVVRRPIVPETTPVPEDPDAPLIPRIAWPRSPLTLRIDGLALSDVLLAEPVLGHALRFDATGAARDEGDVQSVTLDLARSDAVEGRIRLAYARNFMDNTLKVDLDASEAAGGLIPALSGLPADAASALRLSADGPPEDWRAELELDLAETLALAGKAGISYRGPLKIDAALTARPGTQLAPEIAALLGREGELVARITEGADGVVEIAEGRITSPDLNLTASGTYARLTGAADLVVELDAGAALAEPFAGVDFGGLTFAGRVQGAPGDIVADGDLVLAGLATDPVDIARAELTVDVRQLDANGETTTTLDINGVTNGLRLDQISPDVIGEADTELVAELTGDALTLETFWLHSNVLKLSLWGEADLATETAELGFGLSAPDLAPVAGPYGIEATGSIDATGGVTRTGDTTDVTIETTLRGFSHPLAEAQELVVTGTAQQVAEALSFDITGMGQRMRLDRVGPDLLPEATFDAKGTLAEGLLTLDGAVLRTPLIDAGASGQYILAEKSGTIDYQLDTADLGALAALYDQPAAGVLSARGRATLPGGIDAPRVAGVMTGQNIVWDRQRYGRVDISHDVEISPTPSGDLEVTGSGSAYGPFRVATTFALQDQQLKLGALTLRALGAQASGALVANLDGPLVEGDLSLDVRDLRTLGPVTGTPLGGSATGKVRLTARGGRQNAALDLTAKGLATGGVTLGGAKLVASVADALGRPSVDLRLSGQAVQAGGLALDTLDAKLRGPLSALAFEADAAGVLGDRKLGANAAGRASVVGGTTRATISRAGASLDGQDISLNQPLQITARGGTLALKGLDLSLPKGGRLAGISRVLGGRWRGHWS